MRVLLSACVLVGVLCACAGPRPPGWQAAAHASLERYRAHYLDGDSARAQRDFDEAMLHIGSTGRLALAARAHLLRCALATASLDFDACDDFVARQNDADEADRAYGRFVTGQWQQVDVRLLPAHYRSVIEARDPAAQSVAAAAIADPLAQLVASGALFRLGRLTPQGLEAAVATASAQGYRRPLMALLLVQEKRAEAAGDAGALDDIRRRIDLLQR